MASPPDGVTIRPARAGDAAVIVRFNAALARESEHRELDGARLERGVRALLAHPERGFYVVAEDGGRVVGQTMVTFEWSDWRDGTFWWIQSVYVEPEARRRGVFRALYRDVERRAMESGSCGLRLYVEHENRVGQATYERLGMGRTPYAMYEVDFTAGPGAAE